ncbi:MAG: acetyltransferase [Bdellovibrio sp. ArHS]|uniref:GNAT family N-acetyltransferase n=1 Tax=Bdellovibrio sp. ArHS TaxID=1569284 RepID=UPI000582CD0E|nr:GNAT family N-acetyltransferase [Bdellovibrio sp. ArHS]KHD89208.1 MAG: acetyltransferase [Bdellovibrio sp. ArHS]
MDFKHDVQGQKIFTMVEGGEAHILYRRGQDNSYDLYSTEVPPEARGKNVADQLVREALKLAKSEKAQVIATCPYVKKWFEKHPEEKAILKHQ